ncbi:MAG: phosphoglycerate kinase [Candidatus Omnitrophota bacterium]|nr:phosphoglycerate kinase [Candidatus Omnitrophota bacterium]MBU2528911.1 phosphoglycerate kinase [bacterium]MBU3929978.1 phosphoglycerate kinase [bacterium]MBU4122932.1 phosphoglycerate kinase [bacterium]
MKTLKDMDLRDKKVLVRVDFNVPVKNGEVSDDTRLSAHVPTINSILEQRPRSIILMSHLGRPKGAPDPEFSLKVVLPRLEKLLAQKVYFFEDCAGDNTKEGLENLPQGSIALLENLRFYSEEKNNDANFAKKLASYGDVFIQDAFAVSHRAHASTAGIPALLPSAAGFLIQKEVKYLSELLKNPNRPFAAVLGGAKVSTKISVMKSLLSKVDYLLVGGAMSYTFLKARGENTGLSLVEDEFLEKAKEIAEAAGEKLLLPSDHVISKSFKEALENSVSSAIPDGFYGVDIGPETVQKYSRILKKAKTIFWNGPMGVFEVNEFAEGTKKIAEIIAESTKAGAVSVAGGGDSVSAINKTGVAGDFSHISTGGGASLEFVEGRVLPGIEALKQE